MTSPAKLNDLKSKLLHLRNQEVFLDSVLAELLGTTTASLLQTVAKHPERFPKPFVFPVKKKELEELVEQGVLSRKKANSRTKAPLLFTESGAYMAAFLLKTKTAQELSVSVLLTFLQNEASSEADQARPLPSS